MPKAARRIVLASRPVGEPTRSNFRVETVEVPSPGPGDILLRTLFLSLDPYMRGRMSDAPSYANPVGIDEVMEGGTVCEVVESNNPQYAPGDIVLSHSGWQTHALSNGAGLRKLDPAVAPRLAPYSLVNGSITMKFASGFSIGIFGTNLFNQKYIESYIDKSALV